MGRTQLRRTQLLLFLLLQVLVIPTFAQVTFSAPVTITLQFQAGSCNICTVFKGEGEKGEGGKGEGEKGEGDKSVIEEHKFFQMPSKGKKSVTPVHQAAVDQADQAVTTHQVDQAVTTHQVDQAVTTHQIDQADQDVTTNQVKNSTLSNLEKIVFPTSLKGWMYTIPYGGIIIWIVYKVWPPGGQVNCEV